MKYQYKREPLTPDESNRLTNACQTHLEKLVVWTLLDTGLRVAEFANLTKENIDWQGKRLTIYGKGGIYGKQSKRRVVPVSNRAFTLIEKHFGLYESIGITPRTIQRMMKTIANRAQISRPVTPHILRHTFAITAMQRNLSLKSLQMILGHDHLSTTEIYLNLSPEEMIKEYQEKF
jgi:integrase/recombinase XerD